MRIREHPNRSGLHSIHNRAVAWSPQLYVLKVYVTRLWQTALLSQPKMIISARQPKVFSKSLSKSSAKPKHYQSKQNISGSHILLFCAFSHVLQPEEPWCMYIPLSTFCSPLYQYPGNWNCRPYSILCSFYLLHHSFFPGRWTGQTA